MRGAVLILLFAACAPWAIAQRSFARPHFAPHFAGKHYSGRHFRGYGYPWLWDSLDADDLAEPEPPVPERSPLQRILTTDATPPASTAEPLLIELQGDHYLRLSGEDNSTAKMLDISAASSARTLTNSAPAKPAVLIFRDRHREEVPGYTIFAGALYAQSDFYTSGSWHQKIDLTSLDLSATVAENQSRGIRFELPKAPNEVVVGP